VAAARVVVAGLGPADVDLLLPAARRAIEQIPRRFVRTRRHPALGTLEREGYAFHSFDDVYDTAPDLATVYAAIVDALVEAAVAEGEVLYAVPGNPAVAEHTVLLLRDAARIGAIDLTVIPGLSFAELAWARAGVDPMSGAHVVDGRAIAGRAVALPAGPVLIAQCDTLAVLSDVKLTLLDTMTADAPVTVLQRLGLADEQVASVALADLDRTVVPDHLTAVLVHAPGGGAAYEVTRLLELAEQLRRPGGCPWDAEQTHHSLTRYLLEEAYEVVEAVEALPAGAPGGAEPVPPEAYLALEDELGDLLYQVVFHAVLAEEAGAFTVADVARGIHDKLVYRHPHVFGDVEADTTADVMRNWEQLKKVEQGTSSIVANIPPGLPSLLYAHKLYRKAASVGLEPGAAPDAIRALARAADALPGATPDTVEAQLGELLAAAVVFARAHGIDAESALRGWAVRFRDRFEATERLAIDHGIDLASASTETVEALWEEAAQRHETAGS
jgi:tetrapyrrole methylase family protein / MazG family protein